MTNSTFKPGDIVRHATGIGPLLIVLWADERNARCVWYNEVHKDFTNADIHLNSLQKHKDGSMQNQHFEPGDTVRFASGKGPLMVITILNEDKPSACSWYCETTGRFRSYSFDLICLEKEEVVEETSW